MWGNKKSHTPQAADPEPKNWQTNQPPKRTPASWEGTTKMNKDVMRPAGATADRATARLGSSRHVKGEVSGNEDLYIDGAVEATSRIVEVLCAGRILAHTSETRHHLTVMRKEHARRGTPQRKRPAF